MCQVTEDGLDHCGQMDQAGVPDAGGQPGHVRDEPTVPVVLPRPSPKAPREDLIAWKNAQLAARQLRHKLIDEGERVMPTDEEIIGLKAVGMTNSDIARRFGISRKTVIFRLAKPINASRVKHIRQTTKDELVVNSRHILRRYQEALSTIPVDVDHAAAHQQIAKAAATIYDKATHAAGEADTRIESKILSVSIEAKREMLQTLLESYDHRSDREHYSTQRLAEDSQP